MKILSIGNSFSEDAQKYLQRIAKEDGTKMKTVNLYIGGCSLRKHYLNMLDDNTAYEFHFNGEETGIYASIRQALVSDNWDYITLQQASPLSGKQESYFPYIEALAQYFRKYCPHAKLLIHQTWAYENGSQKLANLLYADSDEMLAAIRESYARAARAIDAAAIIPSGEAMMAATKMGIEKIHRDTFHASYGAGRYLLALCWYKALTGKDITNNRFDDFDVPVTEQERQIVIAAVNSVVKEKLV